MSPIKPYDTPVVRVPVIYRTGGRAAGVCVCAVMSGLVSVENMGMSIAQLMFLFVAGIGAGFVGYSVGLASLISYPATLAVGISSVASSATNTVGNVGVTIGGCIGALPELRQCKKLALLYACFGLIGGAIGAWMLLRLPARLFSYAVPWLIAFSALLILYRPKNTRNEQSAVAGNDSSDSSDSVAFPEGTHAQADVASWTAGTRKPLLVGMAVACVYSGYFGAGSGTSALALLSLGNVGPFAQINALKTVGVGMGNISATVVFALTGAIVWPASVALMAGSVIGGWLAPAVVRRIPDRVMRVIACVAGLILAVTLGVRTYW